MSDISVAQALRSAAKLVVVEAPAGCGKTFQAAEYAKYIGAGIQPQRLLILTHTHAACDVFAARTKGVQRGVEIRTNDSFIGEIAALYHGALGLPLDVAAWARNNANGYDEVAKRVSQLLASTPVIPRTLCNRYPIVLCDEHQDSSDHQNEVVMALHRAGSQLRIMGDPVQLIFGRGEKRLGSLTRWSGLCQRADLLEQLDVPHRWSDGASELGSWVLEARNHLRNGQALNLRGRLPTGLQIARVNNGAQRRFGVALDSVGARPLWTSVNSGVDLLILAHYSDTVRSIRSYLNRSLPIWEGHTRNALDTLVTKTLSAEPKVLGEAMLDFIEKVGVGFTRSKEGKILLEELVSPKKRKSGSMPELVQELAVTIYAHPSHVGVAKALARIHEIKQTDRGFADFRLDHVQEFHDATRLASHEDPSAGLAMLAQRRTYSSRGIPRRAISTVHKSKGLESPHVIILPCDAEQFKDTDENRCLLYVALSRATKSLTLMVPRTNPSPLLDLG